MQDLVTMFARPVRARDPDAKPCPKCHGEGVRPKTRLHRTNGVADTCAACGGDGFITRPSGGW